MVEIMGEIEKEIEIKIEAELKTYYLFFLKKLFHYYFLGCSTIS
tara:strand:+ start:723 stop:854 length:132 start_codon:yes stop_codon:yes gene_type:complete